jgi:hypothetical protein
MKKQIRQLITDYPKHYGLKIKANPSMMLWIDNNTMTPSSEFITRLYSAMNEQPSLCGYGRERTVRRFNSGYQFCGKADTCQCFKDHLSKELTRIKASLSPETKNEIRIKQNESMIKKFGVPYSFQRQEVKAKLSAPKVSLDAHSKLTDYDFCKKS